MKTSSCKAKGRNGQKEVVDMLFKAFPKLSEDDIRSTPMGSQGEDVLLSAKARKLMPWSIEVKRKKSFAMVRHIEQAKAYGKHQPIVFFREDRGNWYVCLDAEYFLKEIK